MSQPSDAASPARQTTAQQQHELALDTILLARRIERMAQAWVYDDATVPLRQLTALQRRLGRIVAELQEGDEPA